MGTPDIAATCLKKILADGFEVVGVYTQPDRPKGRGMKMVASPVKEVALANGIPVFQPENFRSEETVAEFAALKPDVCAVVAYGRILPQKILDIPTCGCINIHASILPQYRGSAPYQWAVLDGLKETGVTAQHMVREMDAGDVIDVAKPLSGRTRLLANCWTVWLYWALTCSAGFCAVPSAATAAAVPGSARKM